jgi:primosomal replication protein N
LKIQKYQKFNLPAWQSCSILKNNQIRFRISEQTFLVLGHAQAKVVEYDVMEGRKLEVIGFIHSKNFIEF